MYDEIIQRNPNAKVIFEHLAENREEKELANYGIMLWGNSNYNYGEASMGWTNNSDFSWISYKNEAGIHLMLLDIWKVMMKKGLCIKICNGEIQTAIIILRIQLQLLKEWLWFQAFLYYSRS